MDCKYFGKCGSCKLYTTDYNEQLNKKEIKIKNKFKVFFDKKIEIFTSKEKNFRDRVEFKIFHKDNQISYSMRGFEKEIVLIDSCEIVSEKIAILMKPLLDKISQNRELEHKLFTIEFLSSEIDMLVTLIYHKKLSEEWETLAKELEKEFNISIIGRSRKEKKILSKDFIKKEIIIQDKKYSYNYIENSFTQPNGSINQQMLKWVLNKTNNFDGDLIELYCGAGNFTIPLSNNFKKVLATEISKTSIKSAKINCELNNINNIDFIRMSSEEFSEALNGVRKFRRLENINLDDFKLKTIFIDPPRAGLDDLTRKLVSEFENIIYISCNPETLYKDLEQLTKSHQIKEFAIFDQFPYTEHIESGIILSAI